MAFLNFFSAAEFAAPKGLWEWLILNVFSFVGNYGWRVVVFTVLLKLLLSPLDIYQRVAMKKNQRINERIKPELEKLKKQYANNPTGLQKKQQELNKREGYKMLAGCLPMLVTLAVSIYLLTGLNNISQYKNMVNYAELYNDYASAELYSYARENQNPEGKQYYTVTYAEDGETILSVSLNKAAFGLAADQPIDWENPIEAAAARQMNELEAAAKLRAKEAGQAAVAETFEERRESFLWVKNIWVADVPWSKSVMDEKAFKTAVGKYGTEPERLGISSAQLNDMIGRYGEITDKLYQENNSANGYLVLPILSILVMVGSQMLTRRMQKKSGMDQAGGGAMGAMGGGKMMVYLMPVMFGIFALFYTAAFSLYMIINSGTMIIISLASALVMNLVDKRESGKTVTEEGVLRIGRPDPNAPKDPKIQNPHGAKADPKNKKR